MSKKFMKFLEKEERQNIVVLEKPGQKSRLEIIKLYRELDDPELSFLEFEKLLLEGYPPRTTPDRAK